MGAGAGSKGDRPVGHSKDGASDDEGGAVRTVFVGSGSFAVPALRAAAAAPETMIVGVVTAPPRPAGRHLRLTPSPVATVATELGLGPILTPERLRSEADIAAISGLRPALIVLADYGQLVPAALLEVPYRALNLHPSLLPRHRGASPIPATILAGDRRTGVSLMRMDAGLDTGPIVAVETVELTGHETAPDLEIRLADLGATLLARSLGPWLRGEQREQPQATEGLTLTRPLRRSDGRLDPAAPAHQLERHVRACQPWPGSFVEIDGLRIAIWSARVANPDEAMPTSLTAAAGRVGQIVQVGPNLGLVAADGVLEWLEVQPAGGRRMGSAELDRGRPGLLGRVVDEPR